MTVAYLISIVMDSEILDQLTNLGRDVDSEYPKPKRDRNNRRLKKAAQVLHGLVPLINMQKLHF